MCERGRKRKRECLAKSMALTFARSASLGVCVCEGVDVRESVRVTEKERENFCG